MTGSLTSTKRHNHFISSLNFLLSAHFARVSFILSPAILYFSVFLFVIYIIVFVCLPPSFYHPFSLSIFACFTSYFYGLFIICLSLRSSLFPVFHPVMFDYRPDSLSSITLIALWLTRFAPPLRSPFLTLVCIYSSCMKNITLRGSLITKNLSTKPPLGSIFSCSQGRTGLHHQSPFF